VIIRETQTSEEQKFLCFFVLIRKTRTIEETINSFLHSVIKEEYDPDVIPFHCRTRAASQNGS
jgi:hypothetical protein